MSPEIINLIATLVQTVIKLTPEVIKAINQIKDPDELEKLDKTAFQVDFDAMQKALSDMKTAMEAKEKELLP